MYLQRLQEAADGLRSGNVAESELKKEKKWKRIVHKGSSTDVELNRESE